MDDYNRREFLRTTVPGYLGLVMALPGLTAMATRANAHQGRLARDCKINWDAFLEGVAQEAAKQHLDHWDEPAYLRKVEKLAGQLCLHDPALVEAFEKAKAGIGNGRIDFDRLENREDFQISYLQFEKGEAIPHHDHPGMTGVLLCATGELVTENYTLLDEAPAKAAQEDAGAVEEVTEEEEQLKPERVLLKSAGSTILRKGQTASLTSRQRNIHRVAAGELSQIIDVFAPPYNKQRIADSKWFAVDDEPYRGREGVFEAEER